jgi:hypothetical protein
MDRLYDELAALPQHAFETECVSTKGLHARTIVIPKDHALVGRIHLQEQICILCSGTLAIFTEASDEPQLIVGPFIFAGAAGAQRAGLALTDCVFTTVLATDLTDPEEIFNTLTADPKQSVVEGVTP